MDKRLLRHLRRLCLCSMLSSTPSLLSIPFPRLFALPRNISQTRITGPIMHYHSGTRGDTEMSELHRLQPFRERGMTFLYALANRIDFPVGERHEATTDIPWKQGDNSSESRDLGA
jgi:hypothetical protein